MLSATTWNNVALELFKALVPFSSYSKSFVKRRWF